MTGTGKTKQPPWPRAEASEEDIIAPVPGDSIILEGFSMTKCRITCRTLLVLSAFLLPLGIADDDLANTTSVYASVIRAEMSAAQLAPRQRVCLSLEHEASPTKSLEHSLTAKGIRIIHGGGSKCFRRFGYVVSIERVTFRSEHQAEVLVETSDLTMSEVDFGLRLRHGTYSLDNTSGEWKILGYKEAPHGR